MTTQICGLFFNKKKKFKLVQLVQLESIESPSSLLWHCVDEPECEQDMCTFMTITQHNKNNDKTTTFNTFIHNNAI